MKQLVKEKENFEFKPVKLHLKIDLVPYPARAEGLGKYDKTKPNQTKLWNTYVCAQIFVQIIL